MGSKYIRNIRKVLKSAANRLFGAGADGVPTELEPADARTILSVYSTSEVDGLISAIDGLTTDDIDTLAELNAILSDADVASITYVDSGLSAKQDTLVSGTNIKTVNSTSLLGSGNITVSASPAGSSGQMQFNDAGSFGGAAAVAYAASGTHVTVAAQGATIVPLCVKGAASHSVAYIDCQTSAGASLVVIEPIVANTLGRIRIRSSSADVLNLSVFGTDAYIDCNTGSHIFRTAGSVRTNMTIHNSATRGVSFGQAIQLASVANSGAANSTLYYSTDAAKLVYKDSSGTVHELY